METGYSCGWVTGDTNQEGSLTGGNLLFEHLMPKMTIF